MILGIDEVGRGPWAGPLVVGAVVLGGAKIEGLTDSKTLSKKRREVLSAEILERAAGVGLGWVQASEIDEIGLSASLKLATMRAVEQINTPYHEIIIDGTINFLQDTAKGAYVATMKKADLVVPSVSAASIVAKVARDAYMTEHDSVYPEYGFAAHVGYGTAKHRAAIEQHGVTPLHRLSFGPLSQYRAPVAEADLPVDRVTSKQIGETAEQVVAEHLQARGHDILERNWKTKYCEIDIVSHHEGTIYFTEVKHRKQSRQGGGLAAITRKKHNQMKFAAKFYAHVHRVSDTNLRLAVASTTGQPSEITLESYLVVD